MFSLWIWVQSIPFRITRFQMFKYILTRVLKKNFKHLSAFTVLLNPPIFSLPCASIRTHLPSYLMGYLLGEAIHYWPWAPLQFLAGCPKNVRLWPLFIQAIFQGWVCNFKRWSDNYPRQRAGLLLLPMKVADFPSSIFLSYTATHYRVKASIKAHLGHPPVQPWSTSLRRLLLLWVKSFFNL